MGIVLLIKHGHISAPCQTSPTPTLATREGAGGTNPNTIEGQVSILDPYRNPHLHHRCWGREFVPRQTPGGSTTSSSSVQ